MGKIYLVRHGETVLNIQKRYQGHGDSPLTDRGISQAHALGRKMSDVHIDRAYAADLGRVLATARYILNDRDIEIIQDARLREFFWGDWEGIPYEDSLPFRYQLKEGDNPMRSTLDGKKNGDTCLSFAKRIKEVVDDIAMTNQDKDILVVSSNMAIVFMLNYIEGRDIANCDIQKRYLVQTSLTTIDNDHGKLRIIDEGNTDHLIDIGFHK